MFRGRDGVWAVRTGARRLASAEMLNRSFLEPEIGRQLMDPIAAAHALRQNISASANPDVDGVRLERQLYFALPPFHVVRRKNLGQLVRATAYRKTLLTLSTPSGSSGFPIAAIQLDPSSANCNSLKRSLATSPNRLSAARGGYI